MKREYLKTYSPSLGRDMEVLVFGHAGTPVLVFPTSMGRFFDYENRGMIQVIAHQYGQGRLQAFCVDSVDAESWYNRGIHPRDRVRRHAQYESYLLNELVPSIRTVNPSRELITTGCSFGGYHAFNLALRHPEVVTYAVSMGGAFSNHRFLDGYYDDNCYFYCPVDFLPGYSDEHWLSYWRQATRFVLATAEHDILLDDNLRLAGIMRNKDIAHRLDVWGDGAGHDWPWWQQMAIKFLG